MGAEKTVTFTMRIPAELSRKLDLVAAVEETSRAALLIAGGIALIKRREADVRYRNRLRKYVLREMNRLEQAAVGLEEDPQGGTK